MIKAVFLDFYGTIVFEDGENVAIGIGGVSSALWGTIIAIRYRKHSMKKKIKDFFTVRE